MMKKRLQPARRPGAMAGLAFSALLLGGCAKVSEQSVVLSSVVSQRVSALQASHEAFVQGYFEVTRQRIDDFLRQRWVPVFLGEFVQDATGQGESLEDVLASATPLSSEDLARLTEALQKEGISDPAAALRAIQSVFGAPVRGKLVLQFAEAAIGKIQQKRLSLISPVEELERRTLQELRTAYSQVQQAQNAVTGHLRSLVKVQQEQDQILEKVGLLEKRDALIDKAIGINEQITSVIDSGAEAQQTVQQLEQTLDRLAAERQQPSPPAQQ